jgi:RNA polymerase sigma-70 factor (ECF subfamily)
MKKHNRPEEDNSAVTDAELVVCVQEGDLEALGSLFERYKTLVYRTALAVTRDERAAEDILQECFVRLHTYAASIDIGRALAPWLYRVTVNLAYDWTNKRVMRPLDDVLEWLSGLASAFPTPDRRAEEKETMRLVQEVIAELPPLHRAVIVLFYMEDLSLDEISRVLELPVGTVKSRLHYARGRLRDLLMQRQRLVPEMTYEFT